MTPQKIKQKSIREYLSNLGIYPAKDYGYYGLYHSSYREDHKASMKVDYDKNLWVDYGTGEGGSIIDLVMKMENCSFHEAANRLERKCANVHLGSNAENSFSFHRNKFLNKLENNIENIIPITHPKLITWVQERKIDLEMANRFCREIHYRNNERDYFSIGFRNDDGGYALSSPPDFKRCIGHQNITTFRNNQNICFVFEGFWDFLSYLTIKQYQKPEYDMVILNSTANIQKAVDFLKSHREIYTYLDNDAAGRKTTELIQSIHSTVYNHSPKYAAYKDVNDYLSGIKMAVKPEVQKKKSGIKI